MFNVPEMERKREEERERRRVNLSDKITHEIAATL